MRVAKTPACPSSFVAYYRVSTQQQGRSGLGLDAQREAARAYLATVAGGEIVSEFVEVETGKGANALARRPQLVAALAEAKARGARLLIAKLDRLARNVAFISAVMDSSVEFVCCDAPFANRLMLHIMAAFAEYERELISKRTIDALAAAKARGRVLGITGHDRARENKAAAMERLAGPLTEALTLAKERGLSVRKTTAWLNRKGVPSPAGGRWHNSSVQLAFARLQL